MISASRNLFSTRFWIRPFRWLLRRRVDGTSGPGRPRLRSLRRFGPRGPLGCRRGLLLLGAVVACAVILRVKTAHGTIVLEDVPENAIVEVDGDRIMVTPAVGEPVKIEARTGKHGLVVKRGQDVLLEESVTLESGKQFKLTVTYESHDGLHRVENGTPTNKLPADASPLSMIDRSGFTMLSGQWHVERDELVQTDAMGSYSEILFGDNQWTDYDFTVDAMRVGGGNSFSLFFRSQDRSDCLQYVVSGDSNKSCYVEAHEPGKTRWLKSYDFSLQDRQWYTARVEVRGRRIACFLKNPTAIGKGMCLFEFDDDRHPKGRVGLQTFGSSVRFKNIKVTAPDGRVLWEGPPAVESLNVIESPKPAKEPTTPIVIKQLSPSSRTADAKARNRPARKTSSPTRTPRPTASSHSSAARI